MYKHILIASDGSALSDKAVASGISLAALCGAKVTALKVVPRYPRNYFDGGLPIDLADIKRIEAQWADNARKMLEEIKAKGAEEDVMVRTTVVKSDLVAEAVIATAKKQNCDLIVMASHGRKGLKRVLLGSETLNVLTHSEIPVLVLR